MQCAVCWNSAGSVCSACKKSGYCSLECQAVHWNSAHSNDCSIGVPLKELVLTGNPVEVLKRMSDMEIWTYIATDSKIDPALPLAWNNIDPKVKKSLSKLSDFWKTRATEKNWPWMSPGWRQSGQLQTTNWFKTWFYSRLGNSVLEKFLSTVPDGTIITLRVKYLNSIVLPKLFELLDKQFESEQTEFVLSTRNEMKPPRRLAGLAVTVGSDRSDYALASPTLWQIDSAPSARINLAALDPDYEPPEDIEEEDIEEDNISLPWEMVRFDHELMDPKKCRLASLLSLRYILQFSTRFYEDVERIEELDMDEFQNSYAKFSHIVSCTQQCPKTTDTDALLDALRLAHAEAKRLFRLGFD